MRKPSRLYVLSVLSVLLVLSPTLFASDLDEFKIKREQVFEFAQKPTVTRNGDQVTVTFESKGFCDCTVAIENARGKIIRHLACGVLGDNAPAPGDGQRVCSATDEGRFLRKRHGGACAEDD